MAEILFPNGPHGHKTCQEINAELALLQEFCQDAAAARGLLRAQVKEQAKQIQQLEAQLEQTRQQRDTAVAADQAMRLNPGPAW